MSGPGSGLHTADPVSILADSDEHLVTINRTINNIQSGSRCPFKYYEPHSVFGTACLLHYLGDPTLSTDVFTRYLTSYLLALYDMPLFAVP